MYKLLLQTLFFNILFFVQSGTTYSQISEKSWKRKLDSCRAESLESRAFLGLYSVTFSSDFNSNNSWASAILKMDAEMDRFNDTNVIYFQFKAGTDLYDRSFYSEAYNCLLKASRNVKLNEIKNKHVIAQLYSKLGEFYIFFNRLKEAKETCLRASRLDGLNARELIGIYNSLGLIERIKGNINTARFYYEKALGYALKNKELDWQGIVSGNLGLCYSLIGDYEKAIRLLQKDYLISNQTKQFGSAFEASAELVLIHLKNNKLSEAQLYLKKFQQLVQYNNSIKSKRRLYEVLMTYNEYIGDYKTALTFSKLYKKQADLLNAIQDKENVFKSEINIEINKKQLEISLLKEREKRTKLLNIGLLIILICLVFSSIVILRSIIQKRKKDNEILSLKNVQIQQELHIAENELQLIIQQLTKKNETIEELNRNIENYKVENKQLIEGVDYKDQVEKLQQFTLLTNDDWIAFKRLFDKIYPKFFPLLLEKNKDLSNAEIRLSALLKLNLETAEIAGVLGISIDSVRKASLRLRKKFNFQNSDELTSFIQSLESR